MQKMYNDGGIIEETMDMWGAKLPQVSPFMDENMAENLYWDDAAPDRFKMYDDAAHTAENTVMGIRVIDKAEVFEFVLKAFDVEDCRQYLTPYFREGVING